MAKVFGKPAIAATNIPTVEGICRNLGINKSHPMHQDFVESCHAWKGNYKTAKGVRGTDLVEWKAQSGRQELYTMSAKFLESGRGEEFWPARQRKHNSSGLVFPTNQAEIIELLSQLFFKQNMYKKRNTTYPRPKTQDRNLSEDQSSRESSLAQTDNQTHAQHTKSSEVPKVSIQYHGKPIAKTSDIASSKQPLAKPRQAIEKPDRLSVNTHENHFAKSPEGVSYPQQKIGNDYTRKGKCPGSTATSKIGRGAERKLTPLFLTQSDASQGAEHTNATRTWDQYVEEEAPDSNRLSKRRKTAREVDVAKTPPSKPVSSDGRSPEVRSSRRKRNKTWRAEYTVPSADIDLYIDEPQGTNVHTDPGRVAAEIPSTLDSLYIEGSQETSSDTLGAGGSAPEISFTMDSLFGRSQDTIDTVKDAPEPSSAMDRSEDSGRPNGDVRERLVQRPPQTSPVPQPATSDEPSTRAFQPPPPLSKSKGIDSLPKPTTNGVEAAAPVAQMITSSAEERYRQRDSETPKPFNLPAFLEIEPQPGFEPVSKPKFESTSKPTCKAVSKPLEVEILQHSEIESPTVIKSAAIPTRPRDSESKPLEPSGALNSKSQLTFWVIKSRTPLLYQSKWAKGTLHDRTMQTTVDSISKIMRASRIGSIIFQLQTAGKMIEYVCERDDEEEFEKMKQHFQNEMREAMQDNGNQGKCFEIFIEPVVEDVNA